MGAVFHQHSKDTDFFVLLEYVRKRSRYAHKSTSIRCLWQSVTRQQQLSHSNEQWHSLCPRMWCQLLASRRFTDSWDFSSQIHFHWANWKNIISFFHSCLSLVSHFGICIVPEPSYTNYGLLWWKELFFFLRHGQIYCQSPDMHWHDLDIQRKAEMQHSSEGLTISKHCKRTKSWADHGVI